MGKLMARTPSVKAGVSLPCTQMVSRFFRMVFPPSKQKERASCADRPSFSKSISEAHPHKNPRSAPLSPTTTAALFHAPASLSLDAVIEPQEKCRSQIRIFYGQLLIKAICAAVEWCMSFRPSSPVFLKSYWSRKPFSPLVLFVMGDRFIPVSSTFSYSSGTIHAAQA